MYIVLYMHGKERRMGIRFFTEMLMVQEWGIFNNIGPEIMPQCWYISALLLASLIIYTFLYTYGWYNIKGFVLLFVIGGYSFLMHYETGIEAWGMLGPISLPVARAMCGVLVGVFMYYCTTNDLEYEGRDSKALVRIGEIVSWVLIGSTFVGWNNRVEIIFCCMYFLIYASTSQYSLVRFSDKLNLRLLTKYTYPVYLNHIAVMHFFAAYLYNSEWSKLKDIMIYFIILIIYNITFVFLFDSIKK